MMKRSHSVTRRHRTPTLRDRPIITLTTDFGLIDPYVAMMKAVLVSRCGDARLVDITHNVPRHDVLSGSITLERAIDGFPSGTVHLAVVDPGVGSDRRLLVARINRQLIVCPDNGLITWALHRHGGANAFELTWRPEREPSATFHGRDVMSPVAGMLAAGESISNVARPIDDPILLDIAPVPRGATSGRIIQIDHFGNAMTNVPADAVSPSATFHFHGKNIGKLKRTYTDVSPGRPLAIIGSSGLLELAVRDGSAAADLRLNVGDEVRLR